MGQAHQLGARVGNGRAARLGHQAHVKARAQGLEQGSHIGRQGMFVEGGHVQLGKGRGVPELFEDAPRRFGFFHHEMAEDSHLRHDGLRKMGCSRALGERDWNQVEASALRGFSSFGHESLVVRA